MNFLKLFKRKKIEPPVDKSAPDYPIIGDQWSGNICVNARLYHMRDIWFEIFKMGLDSHEAWRGASNEELQTLYEYWLKEKI